MAAVTDNLLKSRVFCLITGASRGLGRGIAENFSNKFGAGSCILLIARSTSDLLAVKSSIEKSSPDVRVVVRSLDLANPDCNIFKSSITSALEELNVDAKAFETAIIVHNAGSLGDTSKKSLEVENVEEMRKYFDLNVNCPLLINTAFFKFFPVDVGKNRLVINISSLAALNPFKTWVYYCTGKAARDMMFKVMAAEYPSVRVLNYSPGPLKTDMTIRAREETADSELRQWFIDAYADNKMLTVDFTVERLMSILESNKFKSGDHIDVFDGDSETVHSRPT